MLVWIAIANVIVWTGLFVILLFVLMRGDKDLSAKLDKLESRRKTDERK